MIDKVKSWLLPALLILAAPNLFAASLVDSVSQEAINKVAASRHWQSLLHLKDGQPQLSDPKFILSHENFSPSSELAATLALIANHRAEAVCRFPARYYLLNHHFKFDPDPQLDTSHCAELHKYRQFVPFDQVNLIFASEVLSSASSMMGHIFINAEGTNFKGNDVSHSVSFFTEFKTLNIFKLLYDGTIGGMNGFFIVRPYSVDLARYSQTEGRNVWSYQLNMTEFDKQLLKLHIWELKDVDITYFFQSYNCATLTLYLLSIADPKLKDEQKLYVSPIDVVKAANKHGLIKGKKVTLADDWALNMLQQQMDSRLVSQVEAAVFDQAPLSIETMENKSKLLAKQYLSLLLAKTDIAEQVSESRIAQLNQWLKDFDADQLALDLSQYKDPIKTPQDSLIGMSASLSSDDPFVELSFLPASHRLYGDNRQYFSESDLRIGEIALRMYTESDKLQLQRLTLYSVKSYIPTSTNIPRWSGSFHLGYRHFLNAQHQEKGVLDISGSFGKSYRLHRDIVTYGMLGVGLAANKDDGFAYLDPHFGMIVNTVGDSKLLMEWRLSMGQFESDANRQSSSLSYAWYGMNNATLKLSFTSERINHRSTQNLSLGFDYHF